MTTEKLNAKQRAFVFEYLKDHNATQAAIRAGYSEKTAYAIGSDLLKKVEVQAALVEQEKAVQAKSLVTASWVVMALKEVAERCMQRVPVMEFNKAERRLEQVMATNEAGEEVGVWEFDSAGANRALELLGKHTGAFKAESDQGREDLVGTVRELLAEARKAQILVPVPAAEPTQQPGLPS